MCAGRGAHVDGQGPMTAALAAGSSPAPGDCVSCSSVGRVPVSVAHAVGEAQVSSSGAGEPSTAPRDLLFGERVWAARWAGFWWFRVGLAGG